MNASTDTARADFVDFADGRHFYVDTLPGDVEVGERFIVAGKYVVIVAGAEGLQAYSPCPRCGGTGKTVFTWVFDGDCFACGGAVGAGDYRTIAEENKLAKARTRAAARKEAERLAWVAERDAAYEALVATRPAVKAAVDTVLAWDASVTDGRGGVDYDKVDATPEPFEGRLTCWLRDLRWTPTVRLVEAIEGELARIDRLAARKAEEAARVAAAGPAPTGTTEVEGKIVTLKWVPNDFAYNSETPKILVVTDPGWKVWMTCPSKLIGNGDAVGKRIRFTADLSEGGKPDPAFRIGKRPRKVVEV